MGSTHQPYLSLYLNTLIHVALNICVYVNTNCELELLSVGEKFLNNFSFPFFQSHWDFLITLS